MSAVTRLCTWLGAAKGSVPLRAFVGESRLLQMQCPSQRVSMFSIQHFRAYTPRRDLRSRDLEDLLLSKEEDVLAAETPAPKIVRPKPATVLSTTDMKIQEKVATEKFVPEPLPELVSEMQAATPPGLALWSNQTTISEDTRKSIVDIFGYKTMTDVQKQVCDLLPTENDLLVRAKTGTGKTLAFLIAAYENVMKSGGFSVKSSSILILSPTRELALQIANEAKRFVLGQKMTVRTLIGGEDRRRQKKSIAMEGRVDIIVATPGRLIDFLSTEKVMKKRIEQLKVVIFDEADQLLELGFREDMETISSHLPTNRQTFMFSATLSPNIKKIADRVLKEKRISLDTVPKDDVPTHLNVKQTYITAPYSQQVASIYKVISDHREKVPNSKIIVFFPTTRSVTNMSNLFNVISGMDIISIHSKLEQRQRSRISDRFRASRSAVLFTTDVSARGVDYPGVTLVLQVGVPTSTEQYIHRVGRTGRAGKSGEGILILSPYEKKFLQSLTGEVPIKQSFEYEPNLIARDENIQKIISQAFISYDNTDAKDSFYAHLGYYRQMITDLNMSRETLYRSAEDYAKNALGLRETPALSPRLATNLGLSKVRGVRLWGNNDHNDSDEPRSFGGAGESPRKKSFGAQGDRRERSFGEHKGDSFQKRDRGSNFGERRYGDQHERHDSDSFSAQRSDSFSSDSRRSWSSEPPRRPREFDSSDDFQSRERSRPPRNNSRGDGFTRPAYRGKREMSEDF